MVSNGINSNRRLLPEEPGAWDVFFKRLRTWGIAIFFSIWSFILGILVGRETLSLQIVKHDLQKELLRLTQEEVQKKEDRIQKELTLEHTQTELAYPDMLKDRKVDVGDQKNAPTQPFTGAEKQPAKEVKDTKKKAELPKTSIMLKPLPKDESPAPPPGKRLTIQIASYKDSGDADKMIARLKEKGYAAYKASADVGGKAWHRIRIGYFNDRAEAEPVQQRLKKDNFSPILINAD
jgi:cell division septation protein DedD